MNRPRLLVLACMALLGGGWIEFRASRAPAADENASTTAQVRYARAKFRVAELRLQRAKELNQQVPGTLADGVMAQFVNEVELARQQMQRAEKPDSADAFKIFLDREELSLQYAEAGLKKAADANRRAPEVVPASEVERLRLTVEMAQTRLEIGKSLATASNEAKLQFQLEVLADVLATAKDQINLLGQNRLSQFY